MKHDTYRGTDQSMIFHGDRVLPGLPSAIQKCSHPDCKRPARADGFCLIHTTTPGTGEYRNTDTAYYIRQKTEGARRERREKRRGPDKASRGRYRIKAQDFTEASTAGKTGRPKGSKKPGPPCSLCGRPHYARGLCASHYQLFKKGYILQDGTKVPRENRDQARLAFAAKKTNRGRKKANGSQEV